MMKKRKQYITPNTRIRGVRFENLLFSNSKEITIPGANNSKGNYYNELDSDFEEE